MQELAVPAPVRLVLPGQRPPPVNKSHFQLPTPVDPKILRSMLDGYEASKLKFLISGFTDGFSLGVSGPVGPLVTDNHASARAHASFVCDKVAKEVSLKRVCGPFKSPPLPNFRVSPLGVVPKKEPGSFRLIHDLSFPHGSSVNDAIAQEQSTVTLESFDDVTRLVVDLGYNCLIAKADIQEAFRIVPISPRDYHLLGFKLNGSFYFDKVMPMESSSSVRTFEAFSTALQWILVNRFDFSHVSHIVDDFIFVGPESSNSCRLALDRVFSVCSDIGVPIKHDKTVLPTTCAVVHGIEVDTTCMEARLPADKLSSLLGLLANTKCKRKVTLQALQSIIGHLNFACKVVRPGRCFLRRLYDLTCGVFKPHHLVKLNAEARADLAVWYDFLLKYNGVTLVTANVFESSETLRLHSDAAQSKGFACMFGSSWAYGGFSEKVKALHINILELYPIALAVYLFGHSWVNKNIYFMCDNLTIVYCLNKQTSKDKLIMKLLRVIVLTSLRHNFQFFAKHVPGSKNTICDLMSRFQIQRALSLAPHLTPESEQVPPHLSPDKLLL